MLVMLVMSFALVAVLQVTEMGLMQIFAVTVTFSLITLSGKKLH